MALNFIISEPLGCTDPVLVDELGRELCARKREAGVNLHETVRVLKGRKMEFLASNNENLEVYVNTLYGC